MMISFVLNIWFFFCLIEALCYSSTYKNYWPKSTSSSILIYYDFEVVNIKIIATNMRRIIEFSFKILWEVSKIYFFIRKKANLFESKVFGCQILSNRIFNSLFNNNMNLKVRFLYYLSQIIERQH